MKEFLPNYTNESLKLSCIRHDISNAGIEIKKQQKLKYHNDEYKLSNISHITDIGGFMSKIFKKSSMYVYNKVNYILYLFPFLSW